MALLCGRHLTAAIGCLLLRLVPAGNVDEAGFLFSGQAGLQVVLLLVSFVAVPWMLLPKPLILKKRHEASQNVSVWRGRPVGMELGRSYREQAVSVQRGWLGPRPVVSRAAPAQSPPCSQGQCGGQWCLGQCLRVL